MPLFIILFFFVGCAPFQNLSISDVRTDEKLRQSGTLQITLDQAAACAIKTTYACGGAGSAAIEMNPDGTGEFTLFIYGLGLTQANPYTVIDFHDENGMAAYRGYTAMPTWNSTITDQLTRITACGDCSKLN